MPHSLLRRYPGLYDLAYVSSYLFESEAFRRIGWPEPNPQSALSRMYPAASDEDFIWMQGISPASSRTADRMLMVTRFLAGKDDPLLLVCVRNRRPDARSPWYADRFIARSDFEKNGQFAGLPEGEWLRNWAVIRQGSDNNYFGALASLAKLTHPDEIWHYGQTEDPHYPILGNYLRYTFCKLWLEGKICYSEDKTLAAFNTGLVDGKYEFIYAVFEAIPPQNGRCWSLKGFCIAGEQGLGKELLRQFHPVPQPARFFERTSQLIYEIDYELPLERQTPYVDYEHIIRDNLSRFPLPFLRSICFGYQEILTLLEQVPAAKSRPALEALWEQIVGKIDGELFLRIKGQIERALSGGMRRALWNYKTAIPVYFPAKDSISWLLPLALMPGSQADVALVVERFPNGNLEGHTVLDLDMAYTNARLISKPESDWLRPTVIELSPETRIELESAVPDTAVPDTAARKKLSLEKNLLRKKDAPESTAEAPQEAKPKKKPSALSRIASALDILNWQRNQKAPAVRESEEAEPAVPDAGKQETLKKYHRKDASAQGSAQDRAPKRDGQVSAQKQDTLEKSAKRNEQAPAQKANASDKSARKNKQASAQKKQNPSEKSAKKNEQVSAQKKQNASNKSVRKNEQVAAQKKQNASEKSAKKNEQAPAQKPDASNQDFARLEAAFSLYESVPEPEVSGRLDAAISAGFLPKRSAVQRETPRRMAPSPAESGGRDVLSPAEAEERDTLSLAEAEDRDTLVPEENTGKASRDTDTAPEESAGQNSGTRKDAKDTSQNSGTKKRAKGSGKNPRTKQSTGDSGKPDAGDPALSPESSRNAKGSGKNPGAKQNAGDSGKLDAKDSMPSPESSRNAKVSGKNPKTKQSTGDSGKPDTKDSMLSPETEQNAKASAQSSKSGQAAKSKDAAGNSGTKKSARKQKSKTGKKAPAEAGDTGVQQASQAAQSGDAPAQAAKPEAPRPSRSMLGRDVALEQVKLRKGHKGLQGYYQGVLVTVAPDQMPEPPEHYPGTDFRVRLLRINPQGSQYIGKIPKN